MDIGISDLDLTIDVALWKGNKESLIVHISGTHGVEGFAGSAIQNALLSNETFTKTLGGQNPTVILVHGLNPYGYAKLRRCNENNVDLNRNFLSKKEFKEMKARDPNRNGYLTFGEITNPSHPVKLGDMFWLKAAYYRLRYGLAPIKRALVSGNYHFSEGLGYGGIKIEKSLVLLHDLLSEKLKEINPRKCVLIDVHTGLGAKGEDTLITLDPLSATLARKIYDDASSNVSKVTEVSKSGNAVSDGYDDTRGFVIQGIQKLFSNAEVMSFAQEFGTVSETFVIKALRAENAMYHHEPENRLTYAQNLRDVFYLHQSTAWKYSIVSRGIQVYHRAVEYLSASST